MQHNNYHMMENWSWCFTKAEWKGNFSELSLCHGNLCWSHQCFSTNQIKPCQFSIAITVSICINMVKIYSDGQEFMSHNIRAFGSFSVANILLRKCTTKRKYQNIQLYLIYGLSTTAFLAVSDFSRICLPPLSSLEPVSGALLAAISASSPFFPPPTGRPLPNWC